MRVMAPSGGSQGTDARWRPRLLRDYPPVGTEAQWQWSSPPKKPAGTRRWASPRGPSSSIAPSARAATWGSPEGTASGSPARPAPAPPGYSCLSGGSIKPLFYRKPSCFCVCFFPPNLLNRNVFFSNSAKEVIIKYYCCLYCISISLNLICNIYAGYKYKYKYIKYMWCMTRKKRIHLCRHLETSRCRMHTVHYTAGPRQDLNTMLFALIKHKQSCGTQERITGLGSLTWIRHSALGHQLCQQNAKWPHVRLYGEFPVQGSLGGGPLYREFGT